ncbi:MAG: hypothetical protein WB392_09605 [Methanotrichaceae archaeon]
MFFILAGLSSGTMWLYTDPTFFSGMPSNTIPSSFGYQSGSIGSFKPIDLSPFEIINSPIFPMLGHGFSINTSLQQNQNKTQAVVLGNAGTLDSFSPQTTFSGDLENNLKYAESKSSLRVGQGGSWTSLNTPWLI